MSALPAETAIRAPARPRPWRPGKRHIVLIGNGNASGLALARSSGKRAARSAYEASESRLTSRRVSPNSRPPGRPSATAASLSLGGDGTLHAAANLPAGPAELAILPAGRANNVARALGVPLDLKAAAELAADEAALDRPHQRHDRPAELPRRRRGQRRLARARSGELQRAELSRSCRRGQIGLPGNASVRRSHALGLKRRRARGARRRPALRRQPRLLRLRTACCPAAQPDDGLLHVVSLPWEGRARLIPTIARLRRGTPSAALAHASGRRSASGSRRWQVAPHRGHNEPRDGAGDARGRPQRFQWWRHEHRDPRPPLQSARNASNPASLSHRLRCGGTRGRTRPRRDDELSACPARPNRRCPGKDRHGHAGERRRRAPRATGRRRVE